MIRGGIGGDSGSVRLPPGAISIGSTRPRHRCIRSAIQQSTAGGRLNLVRSHGRPSAAPRRKRAVVLKAVVSAMQRSAPPELRSCSRLERAVLLENDAFDEGDGTTFAGDALDWDEDRASSRRRHRRSLPTMRKPGRGGASSAMRFGAGPSGRSSRQCRLGPGDDECDRVPSITS